MKKPYLLLFFFIFLLAGCTNTKDITVEKEYNIIQVTFKEEYFLRDVSKSYFQTNEETLVLYNSALEFVKTDSSDFKVSVKETFFEGDKEPYEISAIVYIPKNKVSEISEIYSKEFDKTMRFSDSQNN